METVSKKKKSKEQKRDETLRASRWQTREFISDMKGENDERVGRGSGRQTDAGGGRGGGQGVTGGGGGRKQQIESLCLRRAV